MKRSLKGSLLLTALLTLSAGTAFGNVGDDLVKFGKKVGDTASDGAKKLKKKAKKAKDDLDSAGEKLKKKVDEKLAPVVTEVVHQGMESLGGDEDGKGMCVRCEVRDKDGKRESLADRPDGCSGPTADLKDSTSKRARPLFTPACNRHDRCYGVPGILQKNCDERFRKDMMAVCAGLEKTDPFNALCAATASTWFLAVRGGGSGHLAGGGHLSGQTWAKNNRCVAKRAKKSGCEKGWVSVDSGREGK